MATLRICFLGDSVTVGTGDATCRGWPSILSEAETARGHDVSCYNLGIRSQTGPEIATRWRAETEPRLPEHIEGRLVFMFGLNDCADFNDTGVRIPAQDSVAIAKQTLVEAARWKPVLWIGPTPVRRSPPSITLGPGVTYTFDRARTAALNDAYREAAIEIDIPYVDLHAHLAENTGWDAVMENGDGVHPTEDGYRRIADIVAASHGWRTWFDG